VLFTFSNVNKIDLPVQFEQLNLMLGWLNPIGVNVDRPERQTSFFWHFWWCEASSHSRAENINTSDNIVFIFKTKHFNAASYKNIFLCKTSYAV